MDDDCVSNTRRRLLEDGERPQDPMAPNPSLGDISQRDNSHIMERSYTFKETVCPGCPNNDPSGFRVVKRFPNGTPNESDSMP